MAVAAAEAGKHVFCEKPVGRDLGETTLIWEAVQRAGIMSFVGLNYRLAPAVMLARDLIAEGRIGEIRQIRVSMRTAYSAGGQNIGGWRYNREQAGAGTLADHGSHVFDLAMHLAGPIARLCGTTSVFVAERPDPTVRGATFVVDNDDTFAALVEFANGANGIIDASRVATGSRGELTFDIVGSAGAVRWDLRRLNELQLHAADAPDWEQGWTTIQTGPANGPYGRFIPSSLGLGYVDTKIIEAHRIVQAVATGEAISPHIGDMVRVARCIEAVQQGGWVEIAR
jgi:predicted dehydrogenase